MRVLLFLLLLIGLPFATTSAQQDSGQPPGEATATDSTTIFQSLYSENDDLLELTIQTDFRTLIRKKYKEEYQPAILRLTDGGGETVSYNLKLRSRGNMRKKACYYPPIKLNFKKSELRENGLAGDDKVKLVLQCRNSSMDESYLLKEYLIYKLYNKFTPYGYRVQLAKVNLEDSEGKAKTQTLHAFLIEPIEELAARNNAKIVERESGSSYMLEREPYKLMSAFQYMIGNTDWSPRNLHNMDLMKVPEYDKLIPIPYDFDYAGFVNTDYAIPTESYPIKTVRDRYYVGFSYSEEECQAFIEHFKSLESEIIGYCQEFKHLDNTARQDVIYFLQQFFNMLDSPKAVHTAFQNY